MSSGAGRGARKHARLVGSVNEWSPLLDEDDGSLQRRADSYGKQVVSTFGQEASVLPYPSVSYKELVDRVLAGRRPFTVGEKGYRDALIWYSALEQAAEGRVLLLTANTKDFSGSDGQLAPDLQSDLACLDVETGALRLARNVAEALEIVRPTSESPPDADAAWKAWLLGENGLNLVNEILAGWQGVPIWSIPDEFPPEVWEVGLLEVLHVLNVEHATTVPSSDPEISDASAVLTAEGVISGWEWYAAPSSLGGTFWTQGEVADLFRYHPPRTVQFAVSARLLPSGEATDVHLSDVRFMGQPALVGHEHAARRMRATLLLLRAAESDASVS